MAIHDNEVFGRFKDLPKTEQKIVLKEIEDAINSFDKHTSRILNFWYCFKNFLEQDEPEPPAADERIAASLEAIHTVLIRGINVLSKKKG
jgi:hypothetical protein